MTPGTILCDEKFKFSDGTIGKKILIVLNDGNPGFYLVVKTTSRSVYKGIQSGCQINDRYPNFFLPEGSCCLKQDTWVQLDQFFEIKTHELVAKHFAGQVNIIGLLPNDIIEQLLICSISSYDITINQEKILKDILRQLKN